MDLTLIFVIVIFSLLLSLISIAFYYSRKVEKLNRKILEIQSQSQQMVQQQAQQLAQSLFSQWVQKSTEQLKVQIENALRQEYEAKLKEWKSNVETQIRKDAISKSINVILGKVGEEFAPVLLSRKYDVNLKDFRHLGSPVDFIAFKGLSDDGKEPEIIFIEIKTSRANVLSDREKKVRDAIIKGKVRYEVVSLSELLGEVKRRLSEEIEKVE
jgi:predicted Holliday junction resolvase-like endonuclease